MTDGAAVIQFLTLTTSLTLLLLFAAFVGSLLTHLHATHKCFQRLRTAHFSVFVSLGSPGFVLNGFPDISRFTEFVRSGKHRSLADPVLESLIERRHTASLILNVAFPSVIVLWLVLAVLTT